MKKIFIFLLFLCFSVSLNAYDNLVQNESYFQKAIEKSKVNEFGHNRVIAVLDTGINEDNPELKGKVIAEYDFTTDSAKAIDLDGHGTKMASIIASANDGRGITGIAYNAKLIDVKVVDANGSIDTHNIINGIDFAVKHGANVINMSFSSGAYSKELEETIAKYAKQGTIFVAAAGNDGEKAVAYPAGYKDVIAVSSLDRKTDKRAIYANYGDHINEYIEDGIWTYDGKKYSREYGTSEACAVVSGYVNENEFEYFIEHKILDREYYELSSVDYITKDSLFTENEENSFLNLQANYSYYNVVARRVIKNTDTLNYMNLEKYTRNPVTRYQEIYNAYQNKGDEANFIILLDLFKNYSSLIKPEEYQDSKAHKIQQDVNAFYKIFTSDKYKSLIVYLKSLDTISSNVITKENQQLLAELYVELLRVNRYKYNKYTSFIRKIGRVIFADTIRNKNWIVLAGDDYTKKLSQDIAKNGEAFKAIKYLGYFASLIENSQKTIETWQTYSDDKAMVEFFKIAALDYLYIISHIDEDSYIGTPNKITESFINYVRNINILETTKQIEKYILVKAVKETGFHVLAFTEDVATIATGTLGQAVKFINGTTAEYGAYYTYAIYRDLMENLKSNALFSTHFGYIEEKDILKNLATSFIVKKHLYYSTKYLQEIAKNFTNNTRLINTLSTVADYFDIEENGYKINNDKLSTLSNISDSIDIALEGLIFSIPKINVNTVETLKNDERGIEKYFKDLGLNSISSDSDFVKFESIFNAYGTLISDLNTYQYFMKEVFDSRYIFDTVANDNKETDKKIEIEHKVHEQLQNILPIRNVNNDEIIGYKDTFLNKTVIFEQERGVTFVTASMLEKMDSEVDRKDFIIMMMKAMGYNPYKDENFIISLLSGEADTFPDIDETVDGKTLSFNEKVWLLYAKKEGIAKGNDAHNWKLFPFDKIKRKEAMTIAGRAVAEKVNPYFSQAIVDGIVKQYNISDYDDLADSQYDNIRRSVNLSIQLKIIHGQEVRGENRYELALEKNLTLKESTIIALRYYKTQYNTSYIWNMLDEGNTHDAIQCPDSDSCNMENANPKISNDEVYTGLKTLVSNETKNFKLNTNIPKSIGDKISIVLTPHFGKISNFSREYDENDKLIIKFSYSISEIDSSHTIPITVHFIASNTQQVSKDYYVSIKPSDTVENLDPTSPSISLIPTYIDTQNQFLMKWQSSNVDSVDIQFSYDQKTWNRFAQYTLKNSPTGEQLGSASGSEQHEKIYFKPIMYQGLETTTGDIVAYSYSPQTPNNQDKSTETPEQAVMRSMDDRTVHDYVTPAWYQVKDSYGNDNAVYYELMYADNYQFDNAQTINVGHNLYYKVENLQDEEKYYFKVRAVNNKGTGEWSNYESIRIDKENPPTLDETTRIPQNGAVGVSKTPTFEWEAEDKDGDILEYYVSIGESPDNLNYKSGWIEGTKRFVYSDEFDKPLKPNTTYYWQISYKEKSHMSSYYKNGEFPKSEIWSFKTLGTGPDLAITTIKRLDEVKIDEWIAFEVTVKNIGSEVADDEDIKPYFYKNGTEIEFASYKRGFMEQQLNPGEEETVVVKVRFDSSISERSIPKADGSYETKTYDNVLVDGDNTVRFKIDYNYNFDVDINNVNDSKDEIVTYSLADNLPVIDYNRLIKNVLSNERGDYRYMLGWTVTYQISAEDQLNISKVEMEYRVNKESEWINIQTITVNDTDFNQRLEWVIPNDYSLITQDMELRVKVYNPSGLYSEVISPPFKVFENDIDIEDIYVDQDTYKLGDTITLTYSASSKYEVSDFTIYLKQGSTSEKLYSYTKGDEKTFYSSNTMQFTIPNNENLIGTDGYFKIVIKDINGAYKIIETDDRFTIIQNTEVPKPFSAYQDVFTQQYDYPEPEGKESKYGGIVYPPDYGITQKTENYIAKTSIDSNGIVHLLISHKGSWRYNYYNGGVDDESGSAIVYYYVTYNPNTKAISSPIEFFESKEGSSTEYYKDFIMNGSIPIMITWNSSTYQVKKYQLNGSSVSASNIVANANFDWYQLVNYNGKTYLTYRYLDSVIENRRLKKMEVYPSIGASSNIVDVYHGVRRRVHEDNLFFYDQGVSYKLNSNFEAITSSKYEIGTLDHYLEGQVNIYDPTVKEVYLNNDHKLVLLNSDNTETVLFEILDSDVVLYNDRTQIMTVAVYNDVVIVVYEAPSFKQYKVVIFNRNSEQSETTFVGNKVYGYGAVDTNVILDSNKKIVIANPDGTYDTAAQVITADLSQGLSSVPSLEVSSDTDTIELNQPFTIHWTLSKESADLAHFKIYKVVNGTETLLDTLDSSVRAYHYTHTNSSEKFVSLKVEAFNNEGESNFAQISFRVIGKVSFSSFVVDRQELNVGENLNFSWQVTGANSNNIYTVYRQCSDQIEWTPLFSTKETSKAYVVNDFLGECGFKLVSGTTERLLENNVTIDGAIYQFREEKFTPRDECNVSGGLISFEWTTWFDDLVAFDLYIKKEGESSFSKITSTMGKSFDYIDENLSGSLDWKVSFDYNGETIESSPIHVKLNKVNQPAIIRTAFTIEDQPKVILTLSAPTEGTNYEIYRNNFSGNFYRIGTTETDSYVDEGVYYGTSYTYYLIGIQNGTRSLPSREVSVSTDLNETYEVIIENTNYESLSGNEIRLQYKPDREVTYENYEILMGTDINNMITVRFSTERESNITGLQYGKTYYVEIYPIDYTGHRLSTLPAKLTFSTGFDQREITETPEITLEEIGEEDISFSWNSVANADAYSVFRSENGGAYEFLEQTSDTSYTDSINLVDGNKYTYVIKALNGYMFVVSDATVEVMLASECIDQITKAYNPTTGEEQEFPSSCDVPNGWIIGEAPDFDGDGQNDIIDTDDDNDGISDEDELKYGLDPFNPDDANEDADGDGVSNIDEINAGTDPNEYNGIPITIKTQDQITMQPSEEYNLSIAVDHKLDENIYLSAQLQSDTTATITPLWDIYEPLSSEWYREQNLTLTVHALALGSNTIMIQANDDNDRNQSKNVYLRIIDGSEDKVTFKRNGWNLISICQDINASDIDMNGIQEIQAQDGQTIYTGNNAIYSNLEMLEAGYGYWVKGAVGHLFKVGQAKGKLEKELKRDGWNLMAACEDINRSAIEMSLYREIQSQDGETIYTGAFEIYSNLHKLLRGYGYWVKSDSGISWIAKDGLSLPSGYTYSVINNKGESIEMALNGYIIKLYSNQEISANAQSSHVGVVVHIGEQTSPVMQIQSTYAGDQIAVGVYKQDDLVGVSELTTVDSSLTHINVVVD